jgi:hypothetical protein
MATKKKASGATKKKASREAATILDAIQTTKRRDGRSSRAIRHKAPAAEGCDDCRARTAFHAWRDANLSPSFNTGINFSPWGIPPAGKRAVIELITATITVPAGEKARLRLFTSLEQAASNLDITVTPQGQVAGKDLLVATHCVRVYSDGLINFNVNRDNAQTSGRAFICISGYLVDV